MGLNKFLTVGDKLKKYRKQFGIKLTSFEAYGFSSAYISMIENNKRIPPKKTLKDIYQSLIELTKQEVLKEISLEEFLLDDREQAEVWVDENLTSEMAVQYYENLVAICFKYNLNKQLLRLEELMAFHYREQKDYLKSTTHFSNCLLYSEYSAVYYLEKGKNYQEFGMYQEALINLQLALKSIPSSELIDDINQHLALTYYHLSWFNKSDFYIQKLLEQTTSSKMRSIALILKSAVLEKRGRFEEGRQILEDYLRNPVYPKHLNYIYHGLGQILLFQKQYREALNILETGLIYQKTEIEKSSSKFLIGLTYYLMKDYENSYHYYEKIKATVIWQSDYAQKKKFIEKSLQLYFDTNNLHAVEVLIKEIQQIKNQEIEVFLKIHIYKQLMMKGVTPSPFIKDYILIL